MLSIQWDNKRTYSLLIVLMVLFAFFRTVDITSDPPPDLSISGALYSDEGFKTYAARNMTLFGDWKWTPLDGYDGWLTKSPFTIYTYTHVFKYLGADLSSIRLIAGFYSLATIILLFFFVRLFRGNIPALVTAGFMGFNYFNIMFSRMGFYEIHLNFFIIATCLALALAIRTPSRFKRLIYFTLTLCAVLATWYIKRSILLILLALIPALAVYLLRARGKSLKFQQRVLYSILSAAALFYLVIAHISSLNSMLKKAMHITINGVRLLNYIPFKAFSPVPDFVGRSFYLEFVFLQPLVFFLSFTYGLYILHKFIKGREDHQVDTLFSSWLVFGFLLMIIMKYHPARYFVILSLPAAYLSMRALFEGTHIISDFIQSQATLASKITVNAYKTFLILAAGITVIVTAVPFSVRIAHIKKITAPIIQGNYLETVPVLVPYLLAETAVALLIFLNRKRIYRFLSHKQAAGVLIAVFLVLNLGQYTAWLASRQHKTRGLSERLGRALPPDTVLAGSWSAQMVLQNNLRALIVQDKSRYNHDLIQKIIANEPIPARGPNGAPLTMQKDLPLYLVICPDVVFEQKIKKKYLEYIKQENLVDSAGLGYFDIKVYRIRK